MKRGLLLFILFYLQTALFGQTNVIKDLDGDAKMDTVYLDVVQSQIICVLSTQNFMKTESKVIDVLNEQAGVGATKNGFSFWNNWIRAGYSNTFRYDKKTARVQLIGMSRYEFGNAANDGSGESSVNLLTSEYIGKWNYYSEKKGELISLSTIKTRMVLPKTYLDMFSDATYFDYAEKCSELFNKRKDQALK